MKQRNYGLLKIVWHVLRLTFQKCVPLFLLFFALNFGTGLFRAFNVFVKQRFFDVVEGVILKTQTVSVAVGWGLTLALSSVFILLAQAGAELLQTNYHQTLIGYLGQNLNQKAARVEPIVFEDKRFLDAINRAYTGIESVMNVAEGFLFILFSEVTYLILLGAYFFSVQPLLLAPFVFCFVPMIASASIRRKMYATMEYKDAPYRRKYEYFEKCIFGREYAKETRLWSADDYFEKLFRENLSESSKLRLQTKTKSDLVELSLRFFQMTGYIATVGLLVFFLMRGEIGVGSFAAIFTSMEQLFAHLERIFQIRLPHLMEDMGPAENYFTFMELEERKAAYEGVLNRKEIVLKNVSFTYPGNEKKALDHIGLTLKKGETVAIVGVNGSGKSTLTRLLIGEYLPTEGTMEIDGIDTKEISAQSMRQGVSAVFQKYQSYKMSIKENVQISQTARKDAVEPVLGQVNFPLENDKFTEGMDTMLGKDFGGTDLSGGQWQRLAIARGLYRVHDMIILDEPTAAIDPIEEANIYRKFAEISKDKTAIIVTHRLGSVHMADRIIVMDAGRIVDMGKHEEMMEKRGLYYKMYQSQAKWYT